MDWNSIFCTLVYIMAGCEEDIAGNIVKQQC